jgi:hypothetical protein
LNEGSVRRGRGEREKEGRRDERYVDLIGTDDTHDIMW